MDTSTVRRFVRKLLFKMGIQNFGDFFFFLLLVMELYSKNQLRAEAFTEMAISSDSKESSSINLNDRLSKIESENSQQRHEISLLKNTVDQDKMDINHLTTTVDQLKGRILQLESSSANHSPTIEKVQFPKKIKLSFFSCLDILF